MKFKVFVDDNFHYMDESERYLLGEYKTQELAVEVCKNVVDRFLKENYKPGMTSGELLTQYIFYGEDPFIVGEDKKVHFSARDYASEKVKEICQDD